MEAQAKTTKKLETGEKYLSISILGQIKLAAFKNKDKKEAKEPDFLGNGVAIWVNEKKSDIKEVL